MIDGMLVIDAHCHIGDYGGRYGISMFGPEEMLARMGRNGVDKAVIASAISPLWGRDDFRRGNDLVIEAVKKYPDRFLGMSTLSPRDPEFSLLEARRGLDAGLKAFKFHPIFHGFYAVDGELMDPFMRLAAEAGVPVVTHSDFNTRCCTPYQVARLAARFPEVKVVMLHLGQDAEAAAHAPDAAEPYPNLYLETSNTPDYPYSVFINPVRVVGASRVMFGSDTPVVSIEANLAKLRAAEEYYGLSQEDKRQILGGTAAQVFGFRM